MSKRKLPKNLKLPLPETEPKEKRKHQSYRMIRLKPLQLEEKKKYVTNYFEQEVIIYNNLPQDYKFKYNGPKRINETPTT